MPFSDEAFSQQVDVVPYRQKWFAEGEHLAARLGHLVPTAAMIDHIGSTSVPGMPAKDCLDMMIRVESMRGIDLSPLSRAGYRERPEKWNREETLGSATYLKRVFAPPVGGRSVNIHVREVHSATARYALLFRDFLRHDDHYRDVWGQFKLRLAAEPLDIFAYGQVKATAQPLLMALAEQWALSSDWPH